jgi:hypothetical protein
MITIAAIPSLTVVALAWRGKQQQGRGRRLSNGPS